MDIDKKLEKTKKWVLISAGVLLAYWVVKYFINMESSKIPLPSVVIQKPKTKKIIEYVTQTGTLVAYKSVDLVARVEGFLEKQSYTDGTFVDEGRELFQIEQKPYYEKLLGAKANLMGKKASLRYAEIEHLRQKRMYDKNATSLNNVQLWSSKKDEAVAGVAKALSDYNLADIDYNYTKVLAPFRGRVGRHLVNIGNLVGNGAATKLATIDMIDPIYVYFNLNEIDLIKIRKVAIEKNFNPDDLSSIPAQIKTQTENRFIHQGYLNYVNTGLNASTGTLEFRALLTNVDYSLLPGLFVEVRIPVTDPIERIVIPNSAVLSDQIGPYVLITDKDNIVRLKRVQLGSLGNGWRVIMRGLSVEDNLIVSGIHNATPDKKVKPISKGIKSS